MKPVHPYIAFEGPIGAGKTTHAALLGRQLAANLVLEDFPDNEFLADFYKDKERWALPMQLSFLEMRHSQLNAVVAPLKQAVVADYSNLKDRIFAQLLLEGRELRLYDQFCRAIQEKVLRHDLIVYLDASNDVLLERIRQRNRAYETSINATYLNSLRDAYDHAFHSESGLKIVRYDTSGLDLTSETSVNRLHDAILDNL